MKKTNAINNYRLGFALYAEHMGVVHKAVQVAGKRLYDQDYEEYVAQGRLLYVEYCAKYYDAIVTKEEVVKFNKLAFNYIRRCLTRVNLQEQVRAARCSEVQQAVAAGREPAAPEDLADDTAVRDQLHAFSQLLSKREREVLQLALCGHKTHRAIASVMGVSPAYVGKLKQDIRNKYNLYRKINNDPLEGL